MTGQRAGGAPNAWRALRTIFLPTMRLPAPPTAAPMPTGSILPNISAPRRTAYRLTKYLSIRVFNRASVGSGSEAMPSASQPPLVRPGPTSSPMRTLAVVADQHGQHQSATPLAVVGGDAVHHGLRQHEECGGLEEEHSFSGARRHRRQRPDPGECRGRTHRRPAGRQRGQIALFQLGDDLGRAGTGVGPPQPGHIGLRGRALDAASYAR